MHSQEVRVLMQSFLVGLIQKKKLDFSGSKQFLFPRIYQKLCMNFRVLY